MSRRSSAFDDDLAGLDELARLPLPPSSSDKAESTGGGVPVLSPPVRPSKPSQAGALAPMPARQASERRQGAAPRAESPDGLANEVESAVPVRAASRRRANVQTAVRLPRDVSKWLSEQAHRQQLTHSSVVAQAILGNREELTPEAPSEDGLLVRRRPRSDSAPITLRFTPAQLELVDGLATEFGCTRSALVLAALRAAMGRPRASA